jgi:hypothetical protein
VTLFLPPTSFPNMPFHVFCNRKWGLERGQLQVDLAKKTGTNEMPVVNLEKRETKPDRGKFEKLRMILVRSMPSPPKFRRRESNPPSTFQYYEITKEISRIFSLDSIWIVSTPHFPVYIFSDFRPHLEPSSNHLHSPLFSPLFFH